MTAQERLDYLLAEVSTPTNASVTLATIKGVLTFETYTVQPRWEVEGYVTEPTLDLIKNEFTF